MTISDVGLKSTGGLETTPRRSPTPSGAFIVLVSAVKLTCSLSHLIEGPDNRDLGVFVSIHHFGSTQQFWGGWVHYAQCAPSMREQYRRDWTRRAMILMLATWGRVSISLMHRGTANACRGATVKGLLGSWNCKSWISWRNGYWYMTDDFASKTLQSIPEEGIENARQIAYQNKSDQ